MIRPLSAMDANLHLNLFWHLLLQLVLMGPKLLWKENMKGITSRALHMGYWWITHVIFGWCHAFDSNIYFFCYSCGYDKWRACSLKHKCVSLSVSHMKTHIPYIEQILKKSFFSLFHHRFESESVSRSVMSDSFRPHGLTRLLCPWNSPGKNTGIGCHALLQGTFPTQG